MQTATAQFVTGGFDHLQTHQDSTITAECQVGKGFGLEGIRLVRVANYICCQIYIYRCNNTIFSILLYMCYITKKHVKCRNMLIHVFLFQYQFCHINSVYLLVLCIDIGYQCFFCVYHCMKLTGIILILVCC